MKICLCGSTRFMDQFHLANVELTLAGHIVYSVATSTKGDFQPTEEQKLALDMVHLRKIHESDCVVVVGRREDGSHYIGESTRRELMYARVWDKTVYFWSPNNGISLNGPVKEFQADLKTAAVTDAEQAELNRQHQEEQERMFQKLGNIGIDLSGDGDTVAEEGDGEKSE